MIKLQYSPAVFTKGRGKLDHSVRAYLERIPIEKLHSVLEDGFIENSNRIGAAVLQDELEVLIIRNKTEKGLWTEYICKIQEKMTQG